MEVPYSRVVITTCDTVPGIFTGRELVFTSGKNAALVCCFGSFGCVDTVDIHHCPFMLSYRNLTNCRYCIHMWKI